MKKEDSRFPTRWILLAAMVLAVVVVTRFVSLQDLLTTSLQWISSLGPWGPLAFAAIYILAAVFFIPGSILTLGAGVVFGVARGVVLVIISATLGATCAFFCGRYLAREWVSRKIKGNKKFRAIDGAVAREGWKIVLLTRLSPVFPFNLLNYAFGVTRIDWRQYAGASFLGMIPGTILYVYIGSLVGDLAVLGSGERTRTGAEWALYLVGLVATLAATIYVTRLARRALEKRVGDTDD